MRHTGTDCYNVETVEVTKFHWCKGKGNGKGRVLI